MSDEIVFIDNQLLSKDNENISSTLPQQSSFNTMNQGNGAGGENSSSLNLNRPQVEYLTGSGGPIVGLEEKHEFYEFNPATAEGNRAAAEKENSNNSDGGELEAELGLWNAQENNPSNALDQHIIANAPLPVIQALEAAAKASAELDFNQIPSRAAADSISQSPEFRYAAVDDDEVDERKSLKSPAVGNAGEPAMKANPLFQDGADDEFEENNLNPPSHHGNNRPPSVSYSFAYGDHKDDEGENPAAAGGINEMPVIVEREGAGEGEGEGQGAGEGEGIPSPMAIVVMAPEVSPADAASPASLSPPVVNGSPLVGSMSRRMSAAPRSRGVLPSADQVADENPVEFKAQPNAMPEAVAMNQEGGEFVEEFPNVAIAHNNLHHADELPPPSFDEAMNAPPITEEEWIMAQEMQMSTLGKYAVNGEEAFEHFNYDERKSNAIAPSSIEMGALIYGGDGKLVGSASPDADFGGLQGNLVDDRDHLLARQLEGEGHSRAALESPDELYARFEHRLEQLHGDKKSHRPIFSYLLAALFVCFCIWPILKNDYSFESQNTNPMIGPSIKVLVDLGAKNVYRMLNGEYWRLISSCILNAGIVQLVMNLITLMQNGSVLEYEYGTLPVVFIFIISGLFGQLLSCAINPNMISVGSTGAVTGFSGASLGEIIHFPNKFDENKGCYVIKILINFMITLAVGFIPLVDNWAILGGFIGGVLASCAVLIIKPTDKNNNNANNEDQPILSPEEQAAFDKSNRSRRLTISFSSIAFIILGFFVFCYRLFSSTKVQNWCSQCEKFGCWSSDYWNCDTMQSLCGAPNVLC